MRRHGIPPYSPSDPSFAAYDRALGALSLDGVVVGHLACRVLEMSYPSRQPWLWFVIVWLDSSREPTFEDYGPDWPVVRELDAGRFEHHLPSITATGRFLGLRFETITPGAPAVFDFEWLPPEVAQARWDELGLSDADF
jgi:hypothetical protein